MKKLLYILMGLFFFACSSTPDQGEVAARAAKQYYDYLLQGDYASFVDGHFRAMTVFLTHIGSNSLQMPKCI